MHAQVCVNENEQAVTADKTRLCPNFLLYLLNLKTDSANNGALA